MARPRVWRLLLPALLLPGPVHAQTVTLYRCTDAQGAVSLQSERCARGSRQEVRTMTAPADAVAPPVPGVPPAGRDGAATMLYGCLDAGDRLSVQQAPCPRGSRQKFKQGVQALAPPPAPAPASAVAATPVSPASPATASPVPATPATEAEAPAPVPADDDRREAPPPLYRCRIYDGRNYLGETDQPPPRCVAMRTTGLGGGRDLGGAQACEVKRDKCDPVPEAGLCAAWRERAAAQEQAWRFGGDTGEGVEADGADGHDAARLAFERASAVLRAAGCADTPADGGIQNP